MLEFHKGMRFGGRYEIIRCVGSGGMGAVYLASDPRYKNFQVALKVMYPGMFKTPEARERFKTETIATYRVTHRNIVRAYEFFDSDTVQAYAMEYVDGGDLQMQMRSGGLPIERVVDILRQAAAGLNAIHLDGIVHRDLKPENILLNSKGLVKIGDFGVARFGGNNSSVTQAGAMVGTPKYFAPEYIETGESDQRGDIYALGVIAYELISGHSPFRADSQVSMMIERIQLPFASLRVAVAHCPPDLAKIVEKAMSVSVNKRYQSAEELYTDLALFEAGKPLQYALNFQMQTEDEDARPQVIKSNIGFGRKSGKVGVRPETVRTVSIWKHWLSACLLTGLLAAGGYYWNLHKRIHDLTVLSDGVYHGTVSGLAKGEEEFEFNLTKDRGSLEVFLERSPCKPARLDQDNQFACGNHTYVMTVDYSDPNSALGTIRVKASKREGSWSLLKSRSITEQSQD